MLFLRPKNRPRLKTQRRRLKTQRRRLKTLRRRLKKNRPRPPAKNRRLKTQRRNSANAAKYSAVLVLPSGTPKLQSRASSGVQNGQQFLALPSRGLACDTCLCPTWLQTIVLACHSHIWLGTWISTIVPRVQVHRVRQDVIFWHKLSSLQNSKTFSGFHWTVLCTFLLATSQWPHAKTRQII